MGDLSKVRIAKSVRGVPFSYSTLDVIKGDKIMALPEKNLRLDNKKRITLGKLAAEEVTSYDAELKENGIIILHPKVEIPAEELWLWKNKEAMDTVRQGLEDSAKGNLVELEDNFWDFLEEG